MDRLGPQADEIYAELVAAHEGLTAEESAALNARLILILMNQVGDIQTLREVLKAAKSGNAAG